jgi:outer membrane protein OmpA-like peptidoglycan-associated protein
MSGAPVLIEAADAGQDKYNQNLSERRASSVRAWFIDNAGVAAGASRPRVSEVSGGTERKLTAATIG